MGDQATAPLRTFQQPPTLPGSQSSLNLSNPAPVMPLRPHPFLAAPSFLSPHQAGHKPTSGPCHLLLPHLRPQGASLTSSRHFLKSTVFSGGLPSCPPVMMQQRTQGLPTSSAPNPLPCSLLLISIPHYAASSAIYLFIVFLIYLEFQGKGILLIC